MRILRDTITRLSEMGSNVATSIKRLFVRNLKWTADANDQTVAEVLQTVAQARLSAISGGKILVSNSGNGHSSTFQVPSEVNPSDFAALASEILDRYDEASAKLIACGNATPTDAELITEILDKLPKNVTNVTNDFRGLRF